MSERAWRSKIQTQGRAGGSRAGHHQDESSPSRASGRAEAKATDEAQRRGETAAYIADLAGDLAKMARSSGLDTLAYILEMASLEADNTTRHMDGRR